MQFPVVRGFCALSLIECLARDGALHRVPVVDRETQQMYNLVTQSNGARSPCRSTLLADSHPTRLPVGQSRNGC